MSNILFVGEGTVTDEIRCKLPAAHIAKLGHVVNYLRLDYRGDQPVPDDPFDAVVFSRPHHDSLMLTYKRMGVPVIVDMDDDFRAIPEFHPGYKFVGLGDPFYLSKLENCLYLADALITATDVLKERFNEHNKNITVIPNGWSADNFGWLVKRTINKDRFVIGWGGTITHRSDFRQCISPIKAILKKYPHVMISIAGDLEIYKHFVNVPDNQKLFMPMIPYQFYPTLLSTWDILLAPLEDTHFNRGKSDIKLVDACAKGIPFVASDMPVYSNWSGGGTTVIGEEGWYNAITQFIEDSSLCETIGKQGKVAAKLREMTRLAKQWNKVIEEAINAKEKGKPYSKRSGAPNRLAIPIEGASEVGDNKRTSGRHGTGDTKSQTPKKATKKANK